VSVSAIFQKIHVRVRVRGLKNFHVRVRDFKINHVRVRGPSKNLVRIFKYYAFVSMLSFCASLSY